MVIVNGKERRMKMIFDILIGRNYRRLWEEQNVDMDKQKLVIHRQKREIKKLELKIERLENEISNLKARRASKKTK